MRPILLYVPEARTLLTLAREDARSRRSMVDKNATTAEKRQGTEIQKAAALNFARRHTNSFKFVNPVRSTYRTLLKTV